MAKGSSAGLATTFESGRKPDRVTAAPRTKVPGLLQTPKPEGEVRLEEKAGLAVRPPRSRVWRGGRLGWVLYVLVGRCHPTACSHSVTRERD